MYTGINKGIVMIKKIFFLILFLILIQGCFDTPAKTIPYSFEIKANSIVGINVDTDALYFGTIGPNSGVRRHFDITNENNTTCDFVLSADGSAKSWLTFENNFTLGVDENKAITVELLAPPNAADGNYAGNINVFLYCKKYQE